MGAVKKPYRGPTSYILDSRLGIQGVRFWTEWDPVSTCAPMPSAQMLEGFMVTTAVLEGSGSEFWKFDYACSGSALQYALLNKSNGALSLRI